MNHSVGVLDIITFKEIFFWSKKVPQLLSFKWIKSLLITVKWIMTFKSSWWIFVVYNMRPLSAGDGCQHLLQIKKWPLVFVFCFFFSPYKKENQKNKWHVWGAAASLLVGHRRGPIGGLIYDTAISVVNYEHWFPWFIKTAQKWRRLNIFLISM